MHGSDAAKVFKDLYDTSRVFKCFFKRKSDVVTPLGR